MTQIHQKCDFCNDPAIYDAMTCFGPWAFMCESHFRLYGCKVEGLYKLLEPKTPTTKKCALCNKVKPVEEFYNYTDKNGVERLRGECKQCNSNERKRQRMKGGHW